MKLKISQVGEAVLRQNARPLSPAEIKSSPTQQLIELMCATMRDAPGVGLAAPQVGLPLQLAVIEDQASYIEKMPAGQAAERRRAPVPFHVIINPKLTVTNSETAEFFEGCLSLPGFSAIVPRALSVRVECFNERAEQTVIEAEGWYARILQHEIDHLHGTLYIDRMHSHSFTTLDNHARYWKDLSVSQFWHAIESGPEN